MLLVIHNLPSNFKYADIKALIQSKCGLSEELIFAQLVSEGPYRRVTVGLADDGDGAILVRKINGLYVDGVQLYVEDIKKKQDSEQPYRSTQKLSLSQQSYDNFSFNDNLEENTQRQKSLDVTPAFQNPNAMDMMMNIAAMSNMYYVPSMQVMPTQNTFVGYGGQQQQIVPMIPQAPEAGASSDRPFEFGADEPGDNIVDWGSIDNRQSDRSRMSYEEWRAPSPPRERSDEVFDRRQSRWDKNQPEPEVESRRRSRSAQRGGNIRDRIDNHQNRFKNYYEDPAPITQKRDLQGYDQAPRNTDPSSSNYGTPRNINPSTSNYGAARNMDPFMSNNETPRNKDPSTSIYRAPRNKDSSTSNYGAFRNNDPFTSNHRTPRNKEVKTSDYGAPRNKDPSTSNYENHRNMDPSTLKYGAPRNMDPPILNYGAPQKKNPATSNYRTPQYKDSPTSNYRAPRNMEPSTSNYASPRNTDTFTSHYEAPRDMDPSTENYEVCRNNDNSASNFGGSGPFFKEPSSNVFGRHVMQPSASKWDQPTCYQNQFESESELFQLQRGGRDVSQLHGGNNPASWKMSNRFEPKSLNRDSRDSGPSRQFENRREEPRGSAKRGSSRWGNDEPQAKKFATPMVPDLQRPTFGKVDPKPEPSKVESLEKLMRKDETWRGQAASYIAKQMVKSLYIEPPMTNRLFTHLKHSIRARINVMLKDRILDDSQIVEMYAAKFPPHDNKKFFTTVNEDLKEIIAKEKIQALADAAVSGSAPVPIRKPVPAAKPFISPVKPPVTSVRQPVPPVRKPIQPVKKPVQPAKLPGEPPASPATKNPANKPPKSNPLPSGRLLPNFPDGDKISYKKTKANNKKDWNAGKYELPEDLKKALDVEVDTMCDIFMSECMNPANDHEKLVCEQIADIVTDDFRRVLRVQTTKRLLNDTKNLLVRVHSPNLMPQRQALERFLLDYGCVALQKSNRQGQLYIAHLNSYEKADKLVALGMAKVDGILLSFKPFQVCGPPPPAKVISLQHKEKIKKFQKSQIDQSNENILQPGYVYNPRAGKDGKTGTDTTKNDNKTVKDDKSCNKNDNNAIKSDNSNIKGDNSTIKNDYTTKNDNSISQSGNNTTKNENSVSIEGDIPNKITEIIDVDAGDNDDDDDDADAGDIPDEADDILDDDNIDEDDLEDY